MIGAFLGTWMIYFFFSFLDTYEQLVRMFFFHIEKVIGRRMIGEVGIFFAHLGLDVHIHISHFQFMFVCLLQKKISFVKN